MVRGPGPGVLSSKIKDHQIPLNFTRQAKQAHATLHANPLSSLATKWTSKLYGHNFAEVI